jgi:hypothetical protein
MNHKLKKTNNIDLKDKSAQIMDEKKQAAANAIKLNIGKKIP